MRKETALLDDIAELSPDGGEGLVIQRNGIDHNPSAGGRHQPGHHPQDCCLATTARSQKYDDFAGLDGKTEGMDDGRPVEYFRYVAEVKHLCTIRAQWESSVESDVVGVSSSMSDAPVAVNGNGCAHEHPASLSLRVAGQTDAGELPARVWRQEVAVRSS